MNRRLLRGLGVLLLVIGACLLAPTSSRAATIESGWWWRANTGSSPQAPAVPVVPAPQVTLPTEPPAPPVPPNAEGGLQVAALPDGALAVAAVRVDAELTSLTLRVAPNGDANGMNAKLAACQAFSPWEPVAGGQWNAKPAVACDLTNGGGSVAGVRAADGASWTFPVAPMVGDGKTDVVIVPLADSELAAGVVAPFQLVFVPPVASDIVIADVAPPSAAPEADATEELFNDPRAYDALTSPGGGDLSAAPAVRPALDAGDQAPVLPVFAATKDPDNGSQVLGAFVILAAVGAFIWASRQPTPALVSLVRGARAASAPAAQSGGLGIPEMTGAPAQVGGLGRFARERQGKPPPLQ